MNDQRVRTSATGLPIVPFWLRAAFVLGALSGLIYFSIVPAPGTSSTSYGPFGVVPYSVWLHFVGYMGLAIVFAYASYTVPRPQFQILFGVFVVTVGCGAAVEILQLTLPTRTFSVFDMLVNALGAGVGVTLWYLFDQVIGRLRQVDRHSTDRERL